MARATMSREMQRAVHQCAIVFALAMSAGSCGTFDPGPCTLIGCEGGLWIRPGESTVGPIVARVTLPSGTVLEAACTGDAQCASGLFFANVTAPSAIIEVAHAGEVRTLDVELTYIEARPNGPDCPPACPIATVILKDMA